MPSSKMFIVASVLHLAVLQHVHKKVVGKAASAARLLKHLKPVKDNQRVTLSA